MQAHEPVVVDSEHEYGSTSRRIIAAEGVAVTRSDPERSLNGWGHTQVYHMDGYKAMGPTSFVPVYTNPEFGAVLSGDDHEQWAAAVRNYEHSRSREEREGLPVTSQDDAALRMLGGATFGPNAKLTLPTGEELDAQTAQAWTAAYAPDQASNAASMGEDESTQEGEQTGSQAASKRPWSSRWRPGSSKGREVRD